MNGALLRRLRATGTRQLRPQPSSERSCRIQAQSDVEAHNRHQQELFDSKVHNFTAPLPAQVPERLARIVSSVPDLADARVIDVGSGAKVPDDACMLGHARQSHVPANSDRASLSDWQCRMQGRGV